MTGRPHSKIGSREIFSHVGDQTQFQNQLRIHCSVRANPVLWVQHNCT